MQKPKLFVRLFILISVSIFLIEGCASFTPFTDGTKAEHGLTDGDLKLVQYYISDPITIVSEQFLSDTKVTNSNVVEVKKVRSKDVVQVEEELPGVLHKIEQEDIIVDFGDNNLLGFSPATSKDLNLYSLKFSYNDKPYVLKSINGQPAFDGSSIMYEGVKYRVRFGTYPGGMDLLSNRYTEKNFKKGTLPILLYKLSSDLKEKISARKVPGRKL